MTHSDAAAAARLEALLPAIRQAVETRLAAETPGEPSPPSLAAAMRYSLLAPAKRARAIVAALATRQCGGDWLRAIPAACALEMVHGASLILDDLPAMDNASLRRGRATCHRTFGEATASLAAIALLNRAFAVVAADAELTADARVAITTVLARSIGTDGLTGGQEGDLNGCGRDGPAAVEWIHARKTAALFSTAAEIGAIVAGNAAQRATLRAFGHELGLAFQGYDDLLDARAASADIGKDTGADAGKATLVSLLGVGEAQKRADRHWHSALSLLDASGDLAAYAAILIEQMRKPLAAGT